MRILRNNIMLWCAAALLLFLPSLVLAAPGDITTAAGNGTAVYSGDNDPAISASLNLPSGVAIDPSGNIYVADSQNYRIRKVDISGTITTVAGNGTQGYSGDNGPATSASFYAPLGVAVDASGNIFIADIARIRKVDTFGIITTVAGNGTLGSSGDNGPATSASLKTPSGVAVDSSGNIYIADMNSHRIRKVDTSGTITTVAGNGIAGYSGDNGPSTAASLNYPFGVAVDSSGNIYISDQFNNRIRKVDAGGTITTVAGNSTGGYSGDNGPATLASLYEPLGVAVDSSGNIYIADPGNQRIRRVDTGGTIATVAGKGTQGYSGDNGPATSASLSNPFGVAADALGNIYIADSYNNRIRKVTGPILTCTGQPDGTPCDDNNACTIGDSCQGGVCAPGAAKTCAAATDCKLAEVCNSSTGNCDPAASKPNGTACNDGKFCTANDACLNGICTGSGNPCPTGTTCNESTDHCDAIDCAVKPAGTACNDNNPCTTNDVCVKSGNKMVCKGTNVANGTGCNDGNPCTTGDFCQGGVCKGTTINCNDHNRCTADSCDPATGACVHTLNKPTSVTILGGLANRESSATNNQIQTVFTVTNGGCVVGSGTDYVYVSAGSVVNVDYSTLSNPKPTTLKLNGVTQPALGMFTCPDAVVQNKLYLDNLKASGGKDVDTIVLMGNAQD